MDDVVPASPLLMPLVASFPSGVSGLGQLVLAVFSFGAFLLLLWRYGGLWGRPALFVLALFMVLYQWPLILFWGVVNSELPNAAAFALSVHVVVGSLLLWLWFTAGMVVPHGSFTGVLRGAGFSLSPVAVSFVFFGAAGSVLIYLSHVGYTCTGLFALVFDSGLTLLAREVSLKLLGATSATYAYGFYANVFGPVVVLLSVVRLVQAIRRNRLLLSMLWASFAVLGVAGALLPGIKGLLLPTLLVLTLGLITVIGDWVRRLAVLVLASVLGLGLMAGFELLRESPVSSGVRQYDFGYCAARLLVCDEARTLIDSAANRYLSLGLTSEDHKRAGLQLVYSCGRNGPLSVMRDDVSLADTSSSVAFQSGTMQRIKRWAAYVQGIGYRLLVAPLQVATWHYLYVAEYGAPGLTGLSFSRRFISEDLNMAVLVYQKYGSVYSGGDRTSTSTAPTSFLLAYTAYLGFWGLVLAVAAVIAFDLAAALTLRYSSQIVRAAGAGLFGVAAANMMSSDFGTVLLTHGAAVGLLLTVAFTLFDRFRGGGKRVFDVYVSGTILIILLPLILLLALAVRVFLRGPVIFRQVRPGLNAKPFEINKFRTMGDAVDCDGNLLPDEQRLTRFGSFLRATSLDELLEFWNVLKGDMSLVGPRPLLMEYLPLYNEEQRRRHEVRPGITGWAQVNGRNALTWGEKFKLDLWYVDHQDMWLDLKILWLTLVQVIKREGINSEGHATMPKFKGTGSATND